MKFKTEIKVIDGNPDLSFLLSQNKKLFVTDENVYALESLEGFFKKFSPVNAQDFSKTDISGITRDTDNFIISDNTRAALYSFENNALVVIPAGEKFKTIDTVLAIIKAALAFSLTRKDVFTAIGGGVITDLAAFAASIYKRGAKVEFVSTTLLGMCDAAIGGKTGCDFEDYKNIAGTFFPADRLYVFPEFVKSLSDKEYISGLAEVIKTALLFDKGLFNLLENEKEKVLARDSDVIYKMISLCVKAKTRIVKKDLTEKKERMLLNLGHTFGHALESRAGLGVLTHGECVAWGTCRALDLSANLGLCSSEYSERVKNVFASYGYETKPVHKAFTDSNAILETMKNDKKNSSSKIRVILQKGLCKNIITEIEDEKILEALK